MNKTDLAREYARRMQAVRRGLRQAKFDGYLILDRANSFYLTGFPCSSSQILLTRDEAWFFTDFRYLEAARKQIRGFEVKLSKNAAKDLARRIKGAKLRRIGVEDNLPYRMALEFQESFSPANLTPDSKPLQDARARKSKYEIDLIRQSVQRCDGAYADLIQDIGEGWSEIEVRNRLRRLHERHGGSGEAFDAIIAAGANASRPHYTPGESRLRRGDVVQIDTGMVFNSYCSDLSRVLSVGRPTDKMRKIYRIVHDAHRRAIDAIRPGALCKDVDAAARDTIAKKGFAKNFGHGTGHGVGLEVHEMPRFSPSSSDVLREGMVVTVEPGIYLPGWGGIRIEDMAVVRRGGCEVLTTARKALAVV